MVDTNKLLEDWLTFSFTNVRVGRSNHFSIHNLNTSVIGYWRPRVYCLTCGALWSMDISGSPCDECGSRKLRMLVCRYRETTKVVAISFLWWNPKTWFRRQETVITGGVWEYRLKESDARLGL